MTKSTYLTNITQIPQLSSSDQVLLKEVTDRFVFRSSTYYLSLIDWTDPDDPIRRLIIPSTEELSTWGELDASHEESYTVAPGVEHKYPSTALLLVTDVCGGYCRFCFRKRLFMPNNEEVAKDITPGVEYIRGHLDISNVLLTGGDPLILSTRRLHGILSQLASVGHVRIVRIGSKMPALNPSRILNDPSLLDMVRQFSARVCIYLMAHFNHPRELTPDAIEALSSMRAAGAVIVNQTPIIRGINDSVEILRELFDTLSFIGVPPYYVFQCRPTLGNEPYSVPVEQAYGIFADAQSKGSGLAKRARFVMSHCTGKIEVVGRAGELILMKYHEAARAEDVNRVLMLKSNPSAGWLDDYEEVRDTKHRNAGRLLCGDKPPRMPNVAMCGH